MLATLLIGLAFGFFGSIPVAGPIAAVVLHRGLTGRAASGALVGLGCAVAEAGYAFLAFWGFATYLARYAWLEPVSRAVAAGILVGLGVVFVRYKSPQNTEEKDHADTAAKSLALGFTVTLLNPTLIATWTGATTTLYSTGLVTLAPSTAPVFAIGAFVGIAGWFGVISLVMHKHRDRFAKETLDLFVRGVGALLLVLAAYFGWRAAVALAALAG
jgi:threonine/homoserine/homoserine lactone efflux protein